MSELSNKYREIMNELDEKITDEEELNFVKNKLSEMSIVFIDIIDRMSEIVEEKVIDIEKGQKNIEKKLARVENVIDNLEQDIYDEGTETEVVCPYCNNEFLAEISEEEESEIECPECHNVIELDMNYDEDSDELSNCSGGCRFCGGCHQKDDTDEDDM